MLSAEETVVVVAGVAEVEVDGETEPQTVG